MKRLNLIAVIFILNACSGGGAGITAPTRAFAAC